jgi:CRISPR system Cascade subunit CasB
MAPTTESTESPTTSGTGASQDLGQTILEWWSELTGTSQGARRRGSTGERAALKRAHSLEEVVLCLGYHDLVRRTSKIGRVRKDWLALVAGVMAHVDRAGHGSFARQMARPPAKGARAPVSEHRFLRLLRLKERDDRLLGAMRRAVALCDRTADVGKLGLSLYWWNERQRKNWALEYFETAGTSGSR